jgi:hypothetical protein
MTTPFDLDKFKSKPAGHIIRSGKRIEVETLEPKAAPKRRKPFAVQWVQTPTGWIRRLRGQGSVAHDPPENDPRHFKVTPASL